MKLLTAANRELFVNLTRREIRGRYKGSWLGVVWSLVTPLVMMGAYTLVFTVVFQVGRLGEIPNYSLFLLTGLALWVFFAGTLTTAASSLIGNAGLVKKVRFPREIVPVAATVSQGLAGAMIVVVLIPLNLWQMPGDPKAMLLLPVVLLACVMMVTGAALAISVLNVYFRDIEHIVAALTLPWFFLTPILYTFDTFPLATQHAWTVDVLKYVNFVTPFILALQDVLYWGLVPSARLFAYIFGVGALFLGFGYVIFKRMERDLAVEL